MRVARVLAHVRANGFGLALGAMGGLFAVEAILALEAVTIRTHPHGHSWLDPRIRSLGVVTFALALGSAPTWSLVRLARALRRAGRKESSDEPNVSVPRSRAHAVIASAFVGFLLAMGPGLIAASVVARLDLSGTFFELGDGVCPTASRPFLAIWVSIWIAVYRWRTLAQTVGAHRLGPLCANMK